MVPGCRFPYCHRSLKCDHVNRAQLAGFRGDGGLSRIWQAGVRDHS